VREHPPLRGGDRGGRGPQSHRRLDLLRVGWRRHRPHLGDLRVQAGEAVCAVSRPLARRGSAGSAGPPRACARCQHLENSGRARLSATDG